MLQFKTPQYRRDSNGHLVIVHGHIWGDPKAGEIEFISDAGGDRLREIRMAVHRGKKFTLKEATYIWRSRQDVDILFRDGKWW